MRKTFYVAGATHRNPVPSAATVRGLLISGVINGVDQTSGKPGATLDEQCSLMFRNLRALIKEAAASPDDVVKLNVWLRDPEDRTALNREWVRLFPDPENRPTRQVHAGTIRPELLVQCEVIANPGQ